MLTFEDAIEMLQEADAVIMYYYAEDGSRIVAEYVGYDNEGDEDSTFSVGAEGLDDLTLYPTKSYQMDHGGIAVAPGVVAIPVKYMKR